MIFILPIPCVHASCKDCQFYSPKALADGHRNVGDRIARIRPEMDGVTSTCSRLLPCVMKLDLHIIFDVSIVSSCPLHYHRALGFCMNRLISLAQMQVEICIHSVER